MKFWAKSSSEKHRQYDTEKDLIDISPSPNQKIYREPPSYRWINSADKSEVELFKGNHYGISLQNGEYLNDCIFQCLYFLDQEKEKPYKIFMKIFDNVSIKMKDAFYDISQIKSIIYVAVESEVNDVPVSDFSTVTINTND